MLGLQTNLNSIGISAAKGIDLMMARDQVNGTLPRSEGNAATSQQNGSKSSKSSKTAATAAGAKALTPDQQRKVEELKQIDTKVRAHEQAHLAVGRSIVTSGPDYTYTYGPDGKQYATAGEVGIDTSAEAQPQKNIDKGQLIQRTALAPQDPSPQDYRVAAVGAHLESTGRTDLAQEQSQQRAADAEAAKKQREAQTETPQVSAPQNAGATRQQVHNAYSVVGSGPSTTGSVSIFA